MKTSYITLFMALIFTSLMAAGQSTEPAKPLQRARISKGYYSISDQLPVINMGTPLLRSQSAVTPPAKGYYSIKQDSGQSRTGSLLPKRARPVIKKGYYSISEEHLQRLPGVEKR